MHNKQIREELKHLIEILHEQFTEINNNQGVIPRIEIDLMKSTLRNLYVLVHQFDKSQNINIDATPEPVQTDSKADTGINFLTPLHNEEKFEVQEIKEEKIKADNDEAPLFIAPAVIEEAPASALPKTPSEIKKEEPAIVFKQETDSIINTTKTFRPVQTASLFDEVSTVAESYSAKTTLHDKMSTGKTDRSVADHLQSKPLSDLKKSIGINEKFVFVKELFEGNHQLFSQSIDQLNNFTAYEQARRHLFEELAGQLQWNTESKAFSELSDLVKRRFTV
jgi:hypothetical protein